MELHRSGYNCAQSVLGAYADLLGMDTATAFRLTSAFGSGLAGMRHVCGSVNAMSMAAGLKKGFSDPAEKDKRKANLDTVKIMAEEFREEHGSIICRHLRGIEPGLAEGKSPKPCAEYIRTGAILIEKYLMNGQE